MREYLKTTSLIVAIIFILATLLHLSILGTWLFELLDCNHEQIITWRSILYPAIWILQKGSLLAWFIMLIMSYSNDQIVKISSIIGGIGCAVGFVINLIAFINGYSEYYMYVMYFSVTVLAAAFTLLAIRYERFSGYLAPLMVYIGMMLFFIIESVCFQYGFLSEIFHSKYYMYAAYFLVALKGSSMAGFMYQFWQDNHLDD